MYFLKLKLNRITAQPGPVVLPVIIFAPPLTVNQSLLSRKPLMRRVCVVCCVTNVQSHNTANKLQRYSAVLVVHSRGH